MTKTQNWRLAEAADKHFSDKLPDFSAIIKQFLWARNLRDLTYIDGFLNPRSDALDYNAFLLLDMTAAVDRIAQALYNGDTIVVFGDYDADGVTSTTLMVSILCHHAQQMWMYTRELTDTVTTKSEIEMYIPGRDEGYGMSVAAIDRLVDKFPKTKLIVTVDNGIKAQEPIRYAYRQYDIQTVVTDHHQVSEDGYPYTAVAVVNPQRPENEGKYPTKELAGVGVAYKVAQALEFGLDKFYEANFKTEYLDAMVPRLSSITANQLDLVMIGTRADVMPSTALENRHLMMRGLDALRASNAKIRPGLQALFKHLDINPEQLTLDDIGFKVAPCINAAGRMFHADIAYYLLMVEDYAEADNYARQLVKLNNDRKEYQQAFVAELNESMREMDTSYATMPIIIQTVATSPHESTHGVVGLLAGEMARQYNRPAIILVSNGQHSAADEDGVVEPRLVASARSVEGFDIHKAITHAGDLLVGFGGHTMAAGLTIEESKLDEFKDRLYQYAREVGFSPSEDASKTSAPSTPLISIDMQLSLADIDNGLYDSLQALEPYGDQSLPAMRFVSRRVYVSQVATLGKDKRHLKMNISDDYGNAYEVVAWSYFAQTDSLSEAELTAWMGQEIDIVYNVEMSYWRGANSLRLKLVDMSLSSQSPLNMVTKKGPKLPMGKPGTLPLIATPRPIGGSTLASPASPLEPLFEQSQESKDFIADVLAYSGAGKKDFTAKSYTSAELESFGIAQAPMPDARYADYVTNKQVLTDQYITTDSLKPNSKTRKKRL